MKLQDLIDSAQYEITMAEDRLQNGDLQGAESHLASALSFVQSQPDDDDQGPTQEAPDDDPDLITGDAPEWNPPG